MQHDVEGTDRHEQSIPQFSQQTLQTLNRPLAIDQHAVSNGDHLVDALSELVTAVLYMNLGRAMGQIASIDIGYPAHRIHSLTAPVGRVQQAQ
jgi:hypothetical protein